MGNATPTATYHVLLVGIDDYQAGPLRGCVNDIDAIQRVLLGDRVGIAPDRIRRLASPRRGAVHDTTIPSRPATLANLRDALAELGSEAVSADDRVFLYYAGHGSRAAVVAASGDRFHRDALVPVDAYRDRSDPRLLFDAELGALLGAITARTRNVTLVLDCCRSAGALRADPDPAAQRARFLDVSGDPAWREPLPDPAGAASSASSASGRQLTRGLRDCHTVSACLEHERAYEAPGHDGVHHGLLTRALVNALQAIPDVALHAVPWGRIWQAMRAEVEDRRPWQHLWMAGSPARAVLAGPPLDGDPGLSVIRTAGADYHIDAGTLAGVSPGGRIAIYGDRPPRFPRLDSPDDRAARIGGILQVTTAGRAAATAEAKGLAFELPPAARGRLVGSGAPDRLRCAVVPADGVLTGNLRGSARLELVEPARAQVLLERAGDSWLVTDDVHGSSGDEPILFALSRDGLDHARKLLEHYYTYALPFRMVALATDLPGGLGLTVLTCPDGDISPAEAQAASWPEAPTRAAATYELLPRAAFCVRVHNRSPERLRVTLVSSASTGAVHILGDQVIDAGTSDVFWAHNRPGDPFLIMPPPGKHRHVDRLTAIGRTAMAKDLGYLRVDQTFAGAVQRASTGEDDHEASAPLKAVPPPERWTAAHVILDTRSHERTLTYPDIKEAYGDPEIAVAFLKVASPEGKE